MLSDDPLWYKDAIIYELHVKAFFDSNDDGIGDFRGLLQKLDYLQSLGVTCIWLMPFYPSPQRDDGYDIADYRNVNPTYGSLRDFREVVREAHARGMRVLTELVINHTSDQHPWFQRARRSPPQSRYRDWYVWSDNDQKYKDTRIIFTDTELSNWTWDPVAQSYFWHRFFSHQPDLNFANPQVERSVIDIMRFWLDLGVDALRLDAIPYLCEREGTSSENLPETHAVLKRLRGALDDRHANRMFLAEANQWPEDVQAYFGDGDECHMAYHFPLMPRMYMGIAQEDRHPITDIMRQTPDIPANCQWAIFLRNHDELTLEMVTDSERDYLWKTYAADSRARINLGIRRRLAPLMENDRRRIELMYSLLMSLPGTPILYYGDEIGMGDNIFLGDRNGVRTPMQWTPDRNGGFSRADPARLYLPPVMDPVYGYQAINVEAQAHASASLLNWTRRLIAVRQSHKVFGRGTLTFLYPENRRILAFLRQYENETVLCVANLSRSAQAFSLDLAAFRGRVPTELLGRSQFPLIREGEYQLSLQGHSFYWFLLHDPASLPVLQQPVGELAPEYVTLVLGEGWSDLFKPRTLATLMQDILAKRLPAQRWYRAKDVALRSVSLGGHTIMPAGGGQSWLLAIVKVALDGGQKPQQYFLPLALDWKEIRLQPGTVQAHTVAKARRGAREGTLYDALADDRFVLALVQNIQNGSELPFDDVILRFRPSPALAAVELPAEPTVRRFGTEQSNSSVQIEDLLTLKIYRRIEPGIQPELEVGRYLTEVAQFANTPALLGSIDLKGTGGHGSAIAVLHAFVRNQGDGWSFTLNYLDRYLDEASLMSPDQLTASDPQASHAVYLGQIRQLGVRVAELHQALHRDDAPAAFRPEPVAPADAGQWGKRARNEARSAIVALRRALRGLPAAAAPLAERLIAERRRVLELVDAAMPLDPGLRKTRIHGDLHLGQVLVAQNDFYIIDFEGEPRRPLAERRSKELPLRDVAGMLRSLHYAGSAALDQLAQSHSENLAALERLTATWRELAAAAFLAGYGEIAGDMSGTAQAWLRLFVLEKACYELQYELANRPGWVVIPLRGILRLLEPETKV